MNKNMSEYTTESKNKGFKDLNEKGAKQDSIKLNKFSKFDKRNNLTKKEVS